MSRMSGRSVAIIVRMLTGQRPRYRFRRTDIDECGYFRQRAKLRSRTQRRQPGQGEHREHHGLQGPVSSYSVEHRVTVFARWRLFQESQG